jgi:DNA-directed RNA polymerase subunit omega
MARVTVEDCIVNVPNRFDLVMMAAWRSRQMANGAPPSIARDNDKNPVIALREIAGGSVSLPDIENALVREHQKGSAPEELDDEGTGSMASDNLPLDFAADLSMDGDDDSPDEAEDLLAEDEEEEDGEAGAATAPDSPPDGL